MNKKSLITLFIILGLSAAGCRSGRSNSSEESSSVVSSSEGSSEVVSSSSSSSQTHTHTPKEEWAHNKTTHWHYCTANDGAKLNESVHTFSVTTTKEATYEEKGTKTYTCTVCGYSYDEDIPQLEHHYSTEWSKNETKHWHACTDTGYTDLKKGEANHSFTSDVTVEATYDHAGIRTYTCSVCGYHYNEDIPQLEHHYSTEWTSSASKHWHACTDEGYTDLKQGETDHTFEVKEVVQPTTTESGYTVYKCSVCNYEKNDDYVDPIGEDHHYSTEWSHDETNHWHACTDEGCDAKADVAKHDYKEEVTLEPSYEAKGIKRYTCKVCGYYHEEDIPQLVHRYSTEWSKNETKHWHACIDEGYTNLKQGEANHTYNSSIVEEANHDHAGTRRYTCSVCGYYYDEVIPQIEHTFSTEWTHDETHHWHNCTGCDAIADKAEHSYGDPVFTPSENPDYKQYIKGVNTYTCECGYSYNENALYTKQEICDLMNAYIAGKDYFDIFEMRDDLDTTYPVEDFGYDNDNDVIVIYEEDSGASSFKEVTVNTFAELNSALSEIATGSANYSVIKLGSDIIVTETIAINSSYPVEIDLNGHVLDNTQENSPAIKITKSNAAKPVVALVNGTIQTKELSGYDLTKSPSCVMVVDATTVRISNMTLNNRAERGYAYIDYPGISSNATVKINDSTITSTIVAVCIQTNINVIDENNISGVVVINGGASRITNNTIDASNVQKGLEQEANRLITSQEVYEACCYYYVEQHKDGYMLTATDAIIIYDRRSPNSTYNNPAVLIEGNTLKCKVGSEDTPYGYAVRYMDLNFDPNKTQNAYDLGYIVFDLEKNTLIPNAGFNEAGGFSYYEAGEYSNE